MNKPNLDAYYNACRLAASDPQRFARFRSDPQIRGTTDTNTLEHGLECEAWIMAHARHLLPWLDTFRRVDSIGMPMLYQFSHVGLFNPTTLRHIVTLARIKPLLHGIYPRLITEIGSSYGALAALFQMCEGRIEEYIIWENAACVELTRKFQCQLGLLDPIRAMFRTGLTSDESVDLYADLIISAYAFSEFDRETQDWYINNALLKAQAGFLVMNTCKEGYTRQELATRLNAEVLPEIPATDKDNYTLVWRKN
jgi:hypothetical protein